MGWNFLKGLKKIAPGAAGAAEHVAASRGASTALDRLKVNAGVPYASIGAAPRNFNASGFLPKNTPKNT
jgi:hypothetical protein